MMKKPVILCSFCIAMFYNAQVGINTKNPQAVFHVDGARDNPSIGEPTNAQQLNDFAVTSTGNVGIGMVDPQRSLDVDAKNGSLRIRNLVREVPDSYDVLTRDISSGDVYASSYSYSSNVTVQSGRSTIITIPSTVEISSGFLVVESTNACGRIMVSNFVYNGLSLAYVSGVARDRIGNATIAPIASGANTSGTWSVNFPNVLGCSGDGDSTQFNFTLIKPTANSYRITNDGNVTRTYRLTINRL